MIREAAAAGVDFLCLPEIFAQLNRAQPVEDALEELDGPIDSFLKQKAKEHRINLVTTVALRREQGRTNTGVIYSRNGELVGTYDKVHLAPGGEQELLDAGTDFPVYEVDGIKVGMQICYDLNFPEGCRILMVKGAEVIFWPNLWGGMPEDYTEVILRARAMENMVCIVSAGSFLGGDAGFRTARMYPRSCVVDGNGTIVAEVGRRVGWAAATLDLDAVYGSQARLSDRRPEVYRDLCR